MSTTPRRAHLEPLATPTSQLDGMARALFDALPMPAWLCDEATFRLIDANASAVRRYGLAREQFHGLSLADLERREDGSQVPGGAAGRRHRLADGSIVAVRIEISRIALGGEPAVLATATEVDDGERAALAAREERFRQMLEAASDCFWETDETGHLTYASPNFGSVFGLAASDIHGKRLNDIPGVEIAPEMARMTVAAIKAQKPYRDFLCFWRPAPGARKRWVQTNAVPIIDGNGQFRGYRGVCREITAQIEAEEALRQSEQRFRQLFEIGSDYSWEMDADYRMSYVSPNYEAVVGVPASEALGKRFADTPGVRVEPEMGKMAILAQKEKKPYRDFVYSRKLANGEIRWFSVSAVPLFGEQGEFIGLRGVASNITERKKAEAAARLAQRQLHDAVAYVTQPFVVFDANDRVAAFNQAFVDLHTLPGSNTLVCAGASFRDLAAWQLGTGFYAESPSGQPVDLDLLLARHQTEEEHSYRLRDNRWMLVAYRRLPGDGKVGLWTDITAIKRADKKHRQLEEQLHHAQRLESLGTLAGGVAHELNNTLVPVVALSKLVLRHLPEGSRDRANLQTIVEASDRARDLVRQILAFSRKQELRRETFDLAGVAADALSLLRASMPASIRLEQALAGAVLLEGDPSQLHQVIVNLVTNAMHAIGEVQGAITVSLEREPDGAHVRLSVSDTGCGMDEATRARIFEPFFTTKVVGQGTGLGLAVVHGIVASHGGRIEVESAPGKGTRVTLLFPVQSAGAAAATT